MKSFKYISVVLVALLALVGCKEKMRELNTNPDLIDKTEVKYMFTGATQNFDWSSVRATANYMNALHKVMQYRIYYTSGNNSAYRDPSLGGATCPSYYDGIIYNELFSQSKGNRLYSIMTYIDGLDEEEQAKYGDIYAICRGLISYMEWRVFETYGASVYTQAFRGISDGITRPEYDYITDVWETLDEELKLACQQLTSTPDENEAQLGTSDYFGGWTTQPTPSLGGGAEFTAVSDYAEQRLAWLRFFNLVRLETAWKLKGQEPGHFTTVLSEFVQFAAQGGIMNSIDDGFYFNYAAGLCGQDDMQEPEEYHTTSDNFVNFLIANKDPRLPYLARFNGATTETSVAFNMMKQYFADSLAKYYYLDGKHPFVGMTADPSDYSTPMELPTGTLSTQNQTFLTSHLKSFNNLPNPLGTAKFEYTDHNGQSYVFAEQDDDEFSTGILIASEVQNRYWVLCGAIHSADDGMQGNGLRGMSNAEYYNKYHPDGDTHDEEGQVGLSTRCRVFTYAKQCFLFSLIGQTIGGKSKEEWYEEGVRAAFDELQSEAIRCRIQAWNGGDTFQKGNPDSEWGSEGHEFPATLTQLTPNGEEMVFNFPYTMSENDIDNYIAAHPYSAENLGDQIWVYGYIDPATAYSWWRVTGYPKFKTHATIDEARNEMHAYFETPYNGDGEAMQMPRRGCLPNRASLNENYQTMKDFLIQQEGFGTWEETNNYIWWELPYVQ